MHEKRSPFIFLDFDMYILLVNSFLSLRKSERFTYTMKRVNLGFQNQEEATLTSFVDRCQKSFP